MFAGRSWWCAGVVAVLSLGCSDEPSGGDSGTGASLASGSGANGAGASGAQGSGSGSGAEGSGGDATGSGGVPQGTGGGASTEGGGELCDTLGWCEITGTKLLDVCPEPFDVGGGCGNVILAWNGGIADEARARLVVWGGGHNDYYGNEVYALDLVGLKMLRLNSPSAPNPNPDSCTGTLPDGTPNSRHTYNGLSYLPDDDRMYVFSGAPACAPGGFDDDTWTLDLETLDWTAKDPTSGGPPAAGVPTSAYDPSTKTVLVHDTTALWRYDPGANSYQQLNEWAPIDYHLTGVVDPARNLFVLFGGGQARAFDLGDPTFSIMEWDSSVSGCDALRDAPYPGLAYDPTQDRIVGWAGGDTIYIFDPDTQDCTPVTWTGGPGPQVGNGTHGRFRYMPSLGVFVLVNQPDQNGYTLRLSPAP